MGRRISSTACSLALIILLGAYCASAYTCNPDGHSSRKAFLIKATGATAAVAAAAAIITNPSACNAFDGGVGGLGKTKPETGIRFRNADLSTDASSATGIASDLTNELLAPDGTAAIVSFDAPWPVLKSSTGVESRDLQNPEAAFLQVAEAPRGTSNPTELKKDFFIDTIFGSKGKYGAYGMPVDFTFKKMDASKDGYGLYAIKFTTFTPGGRESERMVYVSTAIVGNGVFMLVTGSTAPRFRKQEAVLRKIADSFTCVVAPRSTLRSSN